MTVNGTVTTQRIRFGAGGSQFFAQDFGVGNAALHFVQGDTLATPGIASIGFDAASNTLTIDKQSGAVEHLAMRGVDYTGQQFTLTDHQFITLQPAPRERGGAGPIGPAFAAPNISDIATTRRRRTSFTNGEEAGHGEPIRTMCR